MGKKKNSKVVRSAELVLVLFVAFAIPLLAQLRASRQHSEEDLSVGVYLALIHMISAIGVLAYVLFRQGKTSRDIGLSARWRDVPVSILLLGVGLLVKLSVGVLLQYVSYLTTGHTLAHVGPPTTYLSAGITIGTVLFFLLVPFYEEIIVRAYTISELMAMSGSAALAVSCSVIVQSLYHLYQGVPAAISHAGWFLVLALYYLKSRRALPVVLAHLNHNVLVLLLGGVR